MHTSLQFILEKDILLMLQADTKWFLSFLFSKSGRTNGHKLFCQTSPHPLAYH